MDERSRLEKDGCSHALRANAKLMISNLGLAEFFQAIIIGGYKQRGKKLCRLPCSGHAELTINPQGTTTALGFAQHFPNENLLMIKEQLFGIYLHGLRWSSN